MHIKKVAVLFFTILTSVSITACNLEFSNKQPLSEIVTEEKISVVVSELSDVIEETDFYEEESLNNLVNDITKKAEALSSENEVLGDFQKATLVRVVDGDTIVVEINQEEYTVRLIGVNTPESVHPNNELNTEEGMLSSDYTKTLLQNINEIYLQKDVSDVDKYGRLLRYVWLEVPNDEKDRNCIADKMLNGILVRDKVAEPVTYDPDTKYKEDFEYIYENM